MDQEPKSKNVTRMRRSPLAGVPPLVPGERTASVGLRLTKTEIEKLDAVLERLNASRARPLRRAEYIRMAVLLMLSREAA